MSAIEVTHDGQTWTTLPDSSFCSGTSGDNAVVKNTIQPFLDGMPHFRVVTYADEDNFPIATDVVGLRVVFPEQELGYTCYWEIEAQKAETVLFAVKNTVNGDTEYAGEGKVKIAFLPKDEECSAYQVTVNGAEPSEEGWKNYVPGEIPAEEIEFELPQELDAATSFTLYLKGDGKDAYTAGTTTIKSAYGAVPEAKTSGGLAVLMANDYDGATVRAEQLIALSESTDSHGGIVSTVAEDTVVYGNTNLTLTVYNLAGNSASCSVPVTATVAGGSLMQGYISEFLHLGADFENDDLKNSGGVVKDYLDAYGGEANQNPHGELEYEGLAVSGGGEEPGSLVWTVLSTGEDGEWRQKTRENFVKYWHIYIVSPDDRDIAWRHYNDDDLRIWVNGELQVSVSTDTDGGTAYGKLKEGVNSITVKLHENAGDDLLRLALRKVDGQTYFNDLTYRFDPGFAVMDAVTSDRSVLSSGKIKIASIPRARGFTRYQVFQDDAASSAAPGEDWIEYNPDSLPEVELPYEMPEHSGEYVYFSIVLSDDEGVNVKRESVKVPTYNSFASVQFRPFDDSTQVNGSVNPLYGGETAVVLRYGVSGGGLTARADFTVGVDGTFSGVLEGLNPHTDYSWELDVLEGEVKTGFGSGVFTTIGYEVCGDSFTVNGNAGSVGNDLVLTFSENGRVKFVKPVTVDVLVVGGGGGGGNGGYSGGGGGGAGGVIYRQNLRLEAGEYDVIVGKGGAEDCKGGDSVFAELIAKGGGAGYSLFGDYDEKSSGGSGGGAAAVNNWDNRPFGKGEEGQGHDGGGNLRLHIKSRMELEDDDPRKIASSVLKNYSGDEINAGGGGGGAGAPGGSGYVEVKEYKMDHDVYTAFCSEWIPGAGGDGVVCDITGSEVWYGGGGGGGDSGWYRANGAEPSPGGKGGGGGGGGGRGDPKYASNGGSGGDGVVIIRFAQKIAEDSKIGSGGEIRKKDGWIIHTFSQSGKFSIPNSTVAQVLLVGGGGGGQHGWAAGAGGGGGGGMLVLDKVIIIAGSYDVTVGKGGLGGIQGVRNADSGEDSSFMNHTAFGGGAGGGIYSAAKSGGYFYWNQDWILVSGGNGVDGLGGGGGGGGLGYANTFGDGGNGGSGVVIIRYRLRPAGIRISIR